MPFVPFLPSAFPIRKAEGYCRRPCVCPSVCLALPQGTCELPYQYRGHFSRPESLIGIFRQVTMIIRDKILRFAEKFEKKFFATSFFRTKIYLCLSELKKTPSIKILRALWLVCPSWHTWPVSANENRENRPATKWVRPRMRNWSRHVLPSMSAETETCRVSFQSEAISIKIRWVHL